MAQFVCPYDGEEFEQRSRFERHMASSHPPRALTAADVEKALGGIDYPQSKQGLLDYAARRLPPDSEVLEAIRSLPDRNYRDAADVGVGFGQSKAPHRVFASAEPPSHRGGTVAVYYLVSAAAIARVLGGIDFPASKAELSAHANRHADRVSDPSGVQKVIERLPERRYTSMADVEAEVGRLL